MCILVYHCTCVDPWLTKSRKVCPLCKRKVLASDDPNSTDGSSNDDSGAEREGSSESSPLLFPVQSGDAGDVVRAVWLKSPMCVLLNNFICDKVGNSIFYANYGTLAQAEGDGGGLFVTQAPGPVPPLSPPSTPAGGQSSTKHRDPQSNYVFFAVVNCFCRLSVMRPFLIRCDDQYPSMRLALKAVAVLFVPCLYAR
ncbi:unnamed protein product [Soboliphyme baturini]|uniref:RING-type domain-containing protein n=1 Tax=Soboliphyme baturini TaxID=241478 RepID=A0A183IGR2_9BILA|nr:unnamed protein product [Soboliphyme baturini]